MSAKDEDRVDDDSVEDSADEFEALADGDEEEALPDEDLEEFEADAEDVDDDDVDSVVALSETDKPTREQSARALAIRRAIEARQEERQLHAEVDYLDFDFDD